MHAVLVWEAGPGHHLELGYARTIVQRCTESPRCCFAVGLAYEPLWPVNHHDMNHNLGKDHLSVVPSSSMDWKTYIYIYIYWDTQSKIVGEKPMYQIFRIIS